MAHEAERRRVEEWALGVLRAGIEGDESDHELKDAVAASLALQHVQEAEDLASRYLRVAYELARKHGVECDPEGV
jgi:hypothetical protein